MKISWVNKKSINFDEINSKISKCIEAKHFTNGGKNVNELQKKIKNIFKIDDNKDVVMVCNGAMGINALIGCFNLHYNKKLRWVVQGFTFPCSNQGLLIDSIIFDLDKHNMGINIDDLEKNKNDFDGILITNCFGCCVNIELYENFCLKNNKILLFDNAASPMTFYKNKNILNYGYGCMVSLHHTKSIGFGEGGFVVINKKYTEIMKRIICFGYTDTNKIEHNIYASNYKMSEIAAIYIDNYLNILDKIYNHHTNIIKYFVNKLNENKLNNDIELYKNYAEYENSLMSTIPVIFKNFDMVNINFLIENGIEAKKYYHPLDKKCNLSLEIYNKIICFPLNLDVEECDIDFYIENIKKIIN